jgi:hypothetical protein
MAGWKGFSMYEKKDYWEECLASSFEEHGVTATVEQLKAIATDIENGSENIGMAFYSPPPSDRISEIEREWKQKYDALIRDFDKYRGNAETAVKQALHQHSDTQVSIKENGEVFRYGGCTERIQ